VNPESIIRLAKAGQIDAASEACDAALQAEPASPELLHLRGVLFTLSGKPDQAIPFLRRAIGQQALPKHWSNLGNALLATGRLEEAERAYRNALELDPTFRDAWFNLGKLLLQSGRPPEAADVLEHLTRIDPGDGQVWRILGDTYEQFALFSESRQAYERAFASTPGDPDIAALIADCLERENRPGEARQMAEVALASKPQHALGNLVIAIVERRAGEPGKARARLLAMPESQLSLGLSARREHELGVLDDRARAYESAYAHFTRAKALQAQLPALGANPQRFLARYENLIGLDYSWLTERAHVPEDGMTDPLFIVGFPRSGTTLLNQFLSTHTQLHVMEETPVLTVLEQRLTEMQIEYPAGLATLSEEQAGELRRRYFEFVRLAHPDWDGKKRLVDKVPLNIGRLPLAARIFPGARVLLTLRHPYDACLSGFMQLFASNDAMANFSDLQSAALMYDRVFTFWKKLSASLPLPWLPVKYEDLIADPESQMRAVIRFFGLPWEPALRDHTSTIAKRGRINTPSYQQVARPVHRESLGRWVSYASHFKPLEHLLLPHAKAWGYEVEPS
jgi:tetratricopeptide (TPR) repeat protein